MHHEASNARVGALPTLSGCYSTRWGLTSCQSDARLHAHTQTDCKDNVLEVHQHMHIGDSSPHAWGLMVMLGNTPAVVWQALVGLHAPGYLAALHALPCALLRRFLQHHSMLMGCAEQARGMYAARLGVQFHV